MLDVESLLQDLCPRWPLQQPFIAKPLLIALRLLLHEKELRQLEADNHHKKGFDFIEKVLDYFDFSYRLRDNEAQRIPPSGKAVIIANHPIGTLDGLALLKMVREIRPDVKVVANDVLATIEPLQSVLLPVDNMNGNTPRKSLAAIRNFLEAHGVLLIFPAGEVSRLGPKGIQDGDWHHGFLRIATSCQAPILPVHINGRNSAFFYALSFLAKPLSTLWLVREMFKQANRCVDIRIGEPISYKNYQAIDLPLQEKTKLFKRHLYRIGNDRSEIFVCQKAIAHPEQRLQLRDEIRQCELLGQTADNKQIYLYHYQPDACVMREIGRLRELSFRAVDEGTGQRRDLDCYDQAYFHLILWDQDNLEIVGAYRLRDASETAIDSTASTRGDHRTMGTASLNNEDDSGLYSATLFDFSPGMNLYFAKGLELGRSFVQPKYWGKRNLDYLWYGIGAFLRNNPQYRYLFGPVSLSDGYPGRAKDMLIFFYQQHFRALQPVAQAKNCYCISPQQQKLLAEKFPGRNYRDEFILLKSELAHMNLRVPTLYKQYSELCDSGGVQFAGFNIDPDFANCVDGLVIVDLARIKYARRKRYIDQQALNTAA